MWVQECVINVCRNYQQLNTAVPVLEHSRLNVLGRYSPMKITNTQPNQSAIDQSRLQWDFQKQGNPLAIGLIAGGRRLQWD